MFNIDLVSLVSFLAKVIISIKLLQINILAVLYKDFSNNIIIFTIKNLVVAYIFVNIFEIGEFFCDDIMDNVRNTY